MAAFAVAVAAPVAAQNTAYELTDIRYHIEGITLDWALAKLLDLPVGTRFSSRQELDSVITDRRQILVNQRTLATSRIEITTEARQGKADAVVLDVFTKDSWNIIVLPYFKYTDNSGLLLSGRGRDYNFFGTMQLLRLNLNYTYTEDHTHEWATDGSFTLPFKWAERDWTWEGSGAFVYDGDFDFQVKTSLGLDFDLWPDVWTLKATQGYHLLADPERRSTESDAHYNERVEKDTYYYETGLSFGSEIKTGLVLPVFTELKYTPSVYSSVKYKSDGELSDEYAGVRPGFSHGLIAERVDWMGNFRNGGKVSVTNGYTYDILDAAWDRNITAAVSGYRAASPWAFSGRLFGLFDFDKV
jgi:hypothetical protein